MSCGTISASEELKIITLKNGMKVFLKPNSSDADEILIQLAAPGGYANLPEKDHPSGQLAAQVAWESGFGKYTSEQIYSALYKYSIELNIEIFPLYRSISIECYPDMIDESLKFIPLVFTDPKFEPCAFEKILEKKRQCLSEEIQAVSHLDLEEVSYVLNAKEGKNFHLLRPEDLKKASLESCRDLFKAAYQNPKEFICVIVGAIDLEKIIPIIEETLGEIPSNEKLFLTKPFKSKAFPKKSQTLIIPMKCQSKSLNLITFPIHNKITKESIHNLQVCCYIMEQRLRNQFKDRFKCLGGLQVSYQFPYFPFTDHPWLTIQFCSDFHQCGNIATKMIQELNHLQASNGVSQEDVQFALKKHSQEHERLEKSNSYWLTTLANDGLMGWDPLNSEKNLLGITTESIHNFFKKSFNFNQHSRISTQPK